MLTLSRTLLRSLLVGAVAMTTQAAHAQLDRDPRLPEDPNPPKPTRAAGPCAGKYNTTTVDPARPRKNSNFHSIQDAICFTRSQSSKRPKAGVISIRALPPGEAYTETIHIYKPGLTLKPEGDGVVLLRPALNQGCVVIDPRSRGSLPVGGVSAFNTTIEGFAFQPNAQTSTPCISALYGELTLKQSRIDIQGGATIAISVRDFGMLNFVGGAHSEFGVFGSESDVRIGIGVDAPATYAVKLSDVELSNLAVGLRSKARETTLKDVVFKDNEIALEVKDEASSPLVAPNIKMSGGLFENNSDAVILRDRSSSSSRRLAFRGLIDFQGTAEAPLVFARNNRGFTLDAGSATKLIKISNARFSGQRDYAMSLAVADGRSAELSDIAFRGNKQAIRFTAAMNGRLSIRNTVLSQSSSSAAPTDLGRGDGVVDARFASVSRTGVGDIPVFIVDGQTAVGDGALEIGSAFDPGMVLFTPRSTICSVDPNNREFREDVRGYLGARLIKFAGVPLVDIFTSPGQSVSKRDMRAIQATLCQ